MRESGNLSNVTLLQNLQNDVICGHSLVGSNPRGPPVFQALSPYQISDHYLFRFLSSGSDTIKKLKFWPNFLKIPLIFHRSDPWHFQFLAGNLNFDGCHVSWEAKDDYGGKLEEIVGEVLLFRESYFYFSTLVIFCQEFRRNWGSDRGWIQLEIPTKTPSAQIIKWISIGTSFDFNLKFPMKSTNWMSKQLP